MRADRRVSVPGLLLSALALAIVSASGCDSQPQTGTTVQESEALQKGREESIKSAMERGAYGPQYAKKGAPAKAVPPE
jgi:hypothetical protein